jgi:hypothetical protein
MNIRRDDCPAIPRVPSMTRRAVLGLATGVAVAWVWPWETGARQRTKWPRIPAKPLLRESLYKAHDLAG